MVKKMQESDTENEIREAYRVCNFSSFFNVFITTIEIIHTPTIAEIMRQKCGGICGLWVLNEIIKEMYC